MLHQIGVGALGPVFRTYEPTRDRLVAVKVFRLDITPEQSQTLADELGKAAEAGLFHPSVVEPIASGVEGTLAYRAEEYVAAESLDVAMRHYAPAPAGKVLPFITQLAGAIDFARSAGIGHGALHPRDVFLTPEEARATGFGVVEALERVGLRAPVRRPYSAPERVAGGAWGTPADVFSLGVIAYEMLTGRRPSGTGAQIGALSGEYADALHAVLARAMAEDPAQRFPTALAFASAMEAAARGEVVTADQVEESVAVMPPLGDLDVDEEPVQAEQEEAGFRAGVGDFDDIAVERDEDEAHVSFELETAEEEVAAAEEDPFDTEGIEDLALDAPDESAGSDAAAVDRFAGEFGFAAESEEPRTQDDLFDDVINEEPAAGEFVSVADDEPEDDSEPVAIDDADEAAVAPVILERSGPAMLPMALIFIVGLLIGFAAGHVVGARKSPAPDIAAATPAAPPAAAATPAEGGKAYSEQTVAKPAPPAAAPSPAEDAPAPAAPRSAATAGRLVVQSTPSRAPVTVNGQWRGRTPLTLEKVPFGRHAVRVVQPGYAVARQDVTLSADDASRTLSFRLQRSARGAAPAAKPASGNGSIYVASRPAGAQVFLDGKPVGVTPLRLADVSPGSHAVRLQLAGHRPWSTSIRVRAGQQAPVTGSLERIR